MRTQEDLIEIEVMMRSKVSLDRERIIEDPQWASIADKVNLDDPYELKQALFSYLGSYISRQQIFGGESIFMPSTNGPANIRIVNMEIEGAEDGDSTGNNAEAGCS